MHYNKNMQCYLVLIFDVTLVSEIGKYTFVLIYTAICKVCLNADYYLNQTNFSLRCLQLNSSF